MEGLKNCVRGEKKEKLGAAWSRSCSSPSPVPPLPYSGKWNHRQWLQQVKSAQRKALHRDSAAKTHSSCAGRYTAGHSLEDVHD
jgi:hypothetical protein